MGKLNGRVTLITGVSLRSESCPKVAVYLTVIVPDPAVIGAAPHDGLRYGFAPATGDFQRLRGRPPLVSPLKSCMGRSFTAIAFPDQLPWRTWNVVRALCPFCVLHG